MHGHSSCVHALPDCSQLSRKSGTLHAPAPPHDAQVRQRIGEQVQAGDIDTALALTRQLAPGLLEADRRTHFRLQCQKFAELVRRWPMA